MNVATQQRVLDLQAAGEDFEWYPTTDEILAIVARSIKRTASAHHRHDSIIDIGAGDGRALTRLQAMLLDKENQWDSIHLDLYAIEKSMIHLANMPKEIVVVGTDFHEQTLVDKEFGIVFCNPPYTEYEDWAYRILRECAAEEVYLVIPRRWRDSPQLTELVADLGIEEMSLGEFDFETADRQARAKVEVVRFRSQQDKHAAFDRAIEDMLPELDKFELAEDVASLRGDETWREQIAEGGSIVESLVAAYDAQQAEMYETYRSVVKINPSLLKELGVTKENILAGLREKIKGLKNHYWQVLFEHLDDVKKRLATKQRNRFLESLASKTVIDFTHGNVQSMLIWIAKWSSDYCDEQVIDLFKAMAQKATVEKYKSNDKVWKEGNWRYLNEEASHYRLCYRMVLETHGGIDTSEYSWNAHNGLANCSHELLSDFITVANNLGFSCHDSSLRKRWSSNVKNEIWLDDGTLLMDVRAFKNGNLHIRVDKRVMLAINVQVGKLLGWLHSAEEAAEELDVAPEDRPLVNVAFQLTNQIEPANLLRISHSA